MNIAFHLILQLITIYGIKELIIHYYRINGFFQIISNNNILNFKYFRIFQITEIYIISILLF